MEFNKGDIVVLKSGGPKMTIRTIKEGLDAFIDCQWFNGENELKGGTFSPQSLIKNDS